MLLSIVIVNWNTRDMLDACLCSVADCLDENLDYEIFVIDNASADGSPEMVLKKYPSVKLIANDENLGFVRANNQATALTSGKYILLLNSDTKMIDNGASEVIDYMENNPKAGVVTGKVLYENGEFQSPYRRFPGLFGTVIRNTLSRIVSFNSPFQKRFRYDDLDPEVSHEVDWVVGAYLYIRRDLLQQGMIFDEDIFMYYEDTLLCKRASENGYKIVYLPLAPVIHYHGISAKKARLTTILYSFQSSVVYFEHTYGTTVAGFYRRTVKSIWWLSSLVFGLVPLERFREKSRLFRYLYTEDNKE